MEDPPCVEGYATAETWARDRPRSDERPRPEQARSLPDLHAPERLAAAHREPGGAGGDDPSDHGTVDAKRPDERVRSDERERRPAPADGDVGVVDARPHERRHAVPIDSPREQGRERLVSNRARRAAEDDGVDRVAGAPRRRDLAPARRARVAGLHADEPGEDAEEVVPRMHDEPRRKPVAPLADELADDRLVHRDLGEPQDV